MIEEPSAAMLGPMREYHKAIRQQIPDAPLCVVYNLQSVSEAEIDNFYPQSSGADIYPFRHYGGEILTPAFSVQDFSSRMGQFQRLAQHRQQAFEAGNQAGADYCGLAPQKNGPPSRIFEIKG